MSRATPYLFCFLGSLQDRCSQTAVGREVRKMKNTILALATVMFVVACSDDSGNNTESTNEIGSTASSISSSSNETEMYCNNAGKCYKSPLATCANSPFNSECYASCEAAYECFSSCKTDECDNPICVYEWNNRFETICEQVCIDSKDSLDKNSFCIDMIYNRSYKNENYSTLLCNSKTNACSYDFEIKPCTGENCMTDTRDGQVYHITTIGKQTWMAQNLNYRGYVNSKDSLSFCYMDSCSKYGRYYTWAAAMDSSAIFSTSGKNCGYNSYDTVCVPKYPVQGICPFGWHLPDTTEWNLLLTTVGGKDVAGSVLETTTGWGRFNSENTNSVNFSVYPTGVFTNSNNIELHTASFWTSSHTRPSIYLNELGEFDHSDHRIYSAYRYYFSPLNVDDKSTSPAERANSIRCVKD